MRLALFLGAVAVMSCAPAEAPRPEVPPAQAYAAFVERHFAARYAFRPTDATEDGDHAHDAELEDMSKARVERRIAELKKELDELDHIAVEKLPLSDRIDAEALDHAIEAELQDLDVVQRWKHNPMLYAGLPGEAIDALMKRDFAPAAERMKLVTARMRKVPALFTAAQQNLVDMPKEQVDLAVRMAKGSVSFFESDVVQWATELTSKNVPAEFEAARTQAMNAARGFAAWLSTQKATGKFALGEERFRQKLQIEEMIDAPLDQLLTRGETQLAKDWAAFVSTALTIDPKKTPLEVMKSLSADHPTEDKLIGDVAASIEDARKFLVEHDLVTIPSEVRPSVRPTPAFARAAVFASMDTPGPFETKATEAFYYVTPVEPEWDAAHKEEHLRGFNKWSTAIIDVHEVWPGHYLQFLWNKQFPSKVRKLVYATSNGEGWAHYAEQMLVDEGFGGGDPKIRLTQLQEALIRDCRYVSAIKLHTMGWTVAQSAKLFEEKAFMEPANALEEAMRGTYDPKYLAYTWGKLEIQALAKEYREKKKATLKQFHDAFVASGALPLPLVRKLLLGA